MATKQKNVEKETQTQFQLDYGEKTEKRGRGETHMVGLGIWRETLKKPSKRETHTISPKICQEKVKNVNNEKYTL